MPKGMQAIYTQVLSADAVGISFNNIPQTFTDLKILASVRDSRNSFAGQSDMWIRFNGDSSSLYSLTIYRGDGSTGRTSFQRSNQTELWIGDTNTALQSANTFATNDIYIPNYTTTLFKQIICDSATETSATGDAALSFHSGLYRSSAPITSIRIESIAPNIKASSTFTLYGISR